MAQRTMIMIPLSKGMVGILTRSQWDMHEKVCLLHKTKSKFG